MMKVLYLGEANIFIYTGSKVVLTPGSFLKLKPLSRIKIKFPTTYINRLPPPLPNP